MCQPGFLKSIFRKPINFMGSNYCCCTMSGNVDFPLPFITESLVNILDGGLDYVSLLEPKQPNESDGVTLDHHIFPRLVYHDSVLLRFHLIL